MDSVETDPEQPDTLNAGHVARRTFVGKSRTIDMCGKFHLDMWFQPRYVMNKVGRNIKLIPINFV